LTRTQTRRNAPVTARIGVARFAVTISARLRFNVALSLGEHDFEL
jgi:hypothetical protein